MCDPRFSTDNITSYNYLNEDLFNELARFGVPGTEAPSCLSKKQCQLREKMCMPSSSILRTMPDPYPKILGLNPAHSLRNRPLSQT